jgi:hypothetical protein
MDLSQAAEEVSPVSVDTGSRAIFYPLSSCRQSLKQDTCFLPASVHQRPTFY